MLKQKIPVAEEFGVVVVELVAGHSELESVVALSETESLHWLLLVVTLQVVVAVVGLVETVVGSGTVRADPVVQSY